MELDDQQDDYLSSFCKESTIEVSHKPKILPSRNMKLKQVFRTVEVSPVHSRQNEYKNNKNIILRTPRRDLLLHELMQSQASSFNKHGSRHAEAKYKAKKRYRLGSNLDKQLQW